MSKNILEVKDLVVDYGIIRALKGIDINVKEGSIVAILGANGAGKTTTIRTINGVVKAASGDILFDGESIKNMSPNRLASKGIIQSPEGRLILRGLTVEENLLVGAYSVKSEKVEVKDDDGNIIETKRKSARKIKKETLEEIYSYFPILKERRKQQASTLSGGEQQMLAIGRALMSRPKLLLLDEPSLGLAPLIVKDIFEIIQKIRERGNTILIVEQNAYQTLKIADYVYVLEIGKVKTEGTAEDLMKDDQLISAYLGEQK
ncbi:ABC transporter ATP-binding protein [Candidatus Izemoplasma sp. B36]|uniref:ABC transporter ATP-binding protein n=1 Tax=Candidatus Izemoplasma sp. B36 TaxID=3242468 RepID=UPI003558AE24